MNCFYDPLVAFSQSFIDNVPPVKTLSLRYWESLDRYSNGLLTVPLSPGRLLAYNKGLCFGGNLFVEAGWGKLGGASGVLGS